MGKKKLRRITAKINRKKKNLNKKGCITNSAFDRSLDIVQKCNAKSTLTSDFDALLKFFEGNPKKCKHFRRMTQEKLFDPVINFFDGKEATCEVNLSRNFGGFGTAIGRVNGNVITFDGIKYGDHQRFMKSTPAPAPSDNDFSQPSFSCPFASNVR